MIYADPNLETENGTYEVSFSVRVHAPNKGAASDVAEEFRQHMEESLRDSTLFYERVGDEIDLDQITELVSPDGQYSRL